MGFGTLLIGYFLILNITYYTWTDAIAALIMAMGLYKLSSVNDSFKYAFFASLGFAALGTFEAVGEIIAVFSGEIEIIRNIALPLRAPILAVLTVLMLSGIRAVAREVDLTATAARAKRMIPVTFSLYTLDLILNTPKLWAAVPTVAVAVLAMVVIIATLFLVIYNLVTLYSCHMYICMPGEEMPKEKKSRFEIVNKFREHEAQKQQELIDYRREKSQKKRKK